jgi:hypothetical protein
MDDQVLAAVVTTSFCHCCSPGPPGSPDPPTLGLRWKHEAENGEDRAGRKHCKSQGNLAREEKGGKGQNTNTHLKMAPIDPHLYRGLGWKYQDSSAEAPGIDFRKNFTKRGRRWEGEAKRSPPAGADL